MKTYNDIEYYAKIYRDTFLTESHKIADIKYSDIKEKMQLVLETPSGDTTLSLDGDLDTNEWIISMIQTALNDAEREDPVQYASVSFYVKKS